MNVLWQLLWYIVAVGFLVVVHEFGHFWVARRLGFKVLRFSVGFGKPLLRREVGPDRTEIVLAPIPMGGYVKMLDEREGPVPTEDLARSFTRRPPWQRILVLFAGPAFNVLFAILVLWGMLWASGITEVKSIVGDVTAGSAAARAGLRSGDEIVAINGHSITDQRDVLFGLLDSILARGSADLTLHGTDNRDRHAALEVSDPEQRRRMTEFPSLLKEIGFQFDELPAPAVLGQVQAGGAASRAGLVSGDRILAIDGFPMREFGDLQKYISGVPGKTVVIRYQRGQAEHEASVAVGSVKSGGHIQGRIGVSNPMVRHIDLSPLGALSAATSQAWNLTAMQSRLLWRMVLGQVSLKNLSGPISIAQFAGESADAGFASFLSFLVLISLAIALFNLLPIPILDGGQIVFQAAEWLKGSPLSERTQAFGQQVGIAVLVLLLGVALFNDVSRQLG
jgi:regulator of sigma E protease